MLDRIDLDNLKVGQKVTIRCTLGEKYTIERRENGLYLYGYHSGTDTAEAHNPAAPWELRRIWGQSDNFIVLGRRMGFSVDDIYIGKGGHCVGCGEVLEITLE